jgi:glycine/D-amino acid oxidase-like deaminating enzyme
MVFGGRAAFFPATDRTVRDSARILQRDLVRVFPELARTEIAYAWGGTVGFTFDLFPHAGRMDGLWYAMGYAGHGVAMATYLGQQMANRILGQPADNPFEALDFPALPVYDGRPWFLPFAAAWYRLLDWVS